LEPPLQPGEVDDGFGPVLPDPRLDQRPGMAELPEIVVGGPNDDPARIRKSGRQRIAKAICRGHRHLSPAPWHATHRPVKGSGFDSLTFRVLTEGVVKKSKPDPLTGMRGGS